MLRYVKYQIKSETSPVNGKWFLRVKSTEHVSVDQLAAHMAVHNTPYSKGAIRGILTDMVACIKELLLEGKTVKLADLAIFSLGVSCKGAASAEEAVPANITAVTFNARGTGSLDAGSRKSEAKFKEQELYTGFNENGADSDSDAE